jgi:hypothetical protein
MGERPGDRDAIRRALNHVRVRVPRALSVSFQTSDQDIVGFVLVGVALPSGNDLADGSPVAFEELADEIWLLVSAIGWDGVMGEDRFGGVTIVLDNVNYAADDRHPR